MSVLGFFFPPQSLTSPFIKIPANFCTEMTFRTTTLKNSVSVEPQYKIVEMCLEWIAFEHCPYSTCTIYPLLCGV